MSIDFAPVVALVSVAAATVSVVSVVQEAAKAPPIVGYAEYSLPVRADEVAMLKWNITKNTDCEGVLGRVWQGEDGFYLSEVQRASGLPEGDGTYFIPTEIPDGVPAGDLELSIKGFYQCDNNDPDYFTLGPVSLEVVE